MYNTIKVKKEMSKIKTRVEKKESEVRIKLQKWYKRCNKKAKIKMRIKKGQMIKQKYD